MTNRQSILLSLFTAAALLVLTSVSTAGVPIDPRLDGILVTIKPGESVESFVDELVATHAGVTAEVIDQIPNRDAYRIDVDLGGGGDVLADTIELEMESGFYAALLSGEFLYGNRSAEGHTGSTWVSGIASAAYETQYSTSLLGLADAHMRSTGLGTVVAVLDTGVDDTHPLLAGRVLPFGYDFVDDDADPDDIEDGVDHDGDLTADEMYGHGTFVAGLVTLVAPDARILPVRVLNPDGTGNQWTAAQGLYYAIDRGVEVINLSLGSTYDSMLVKQALVEAACRGIIVTASAGNFDQEDVRERPAMDDVGCDLADPKDDCDAVTPIGGCPIDPESFDMIGALGIAATDHADRKANFSNFHRKVVLSAPGDVTATVPEEAIISSRPDGVYAAWEGTSFANAFAAGAAALVRAQHPEWGATLTDAYDGVQWALTATAVDIYDLNPAYAEDQTLGVGRLDVGAATGVGPVAPTMLGDFDVSGTVDFIDLLTLLGSWGEVHSSADLDGDGNVGFGDLLVLLSSWT